MTRTDLIKVPGFAEWASTPEAQRFLPLLAEVVDHDIGASFYTMPEPHWVHVNLGIQDAVRRTRHILRNPLVPAPERGPTPRPHYGIKDDLST